MTHRPSLDALRGFLSLVVVIAHVCQVFVQPVSGPSVFLGWAARIAVLCFFGLSGYVIAMSLHANRRRGFQIGAYAMARVRRIVPPLLAVILLTAVAQIVLMMLGADYMPIAKAARAAFGSNPSEQLLALVSLTLAGDLTGMGLNGPLWSLAYEIQLYVIAGLCALIAWAKPYIKALAAALLLLYVFHISVWVAFDLQALCFVCFALGAAATALGTSTLTALDGWLRGSFIASAGQYSYTLYIGHFPLLLFLSFLAHHFAPASLSAQWAPLTAVAAMAVTWLTLASLGRLVERPDLFRRTSLAPVPAQ